MLCYLFYPIIYSQTNKEIRHIALKRLYVGGLVLVWTWFMVRSYQERLCIYSLSVLPLDQPDL